MQQDVSECVCVCVCVCVCAPVVHVSMRKHRSMQQVCAEYLTSYVHHTVCVCVYVLHTHTHTHNHTTHMYAYTYVCVYTD